MSHVILSPSLADLSQEYVLVPAWKKAHDYIRRHNWYADVLELDLTNADLGATIKSIAEEVRSPGPLLPSQLRLVLAPKTQPWEIKDGEWRPMGGPASVQRKLRPLAHLPVRDQIISTAFMILLANIVESAQGDPRVSPEKARELGMVSYGHRLFCDRLDDQLHFRWGSASTYRQYFQDYQNFIARRVPLLAALGQQ